MLTVALYSCKEKEAKVEGPTQMEQVMAVHDELMPKMSTIGSLIGKLEASIDTTQVDSMKLKGIEELKNANESMMVWMKDFGTAFESEEILKGKALTEEKVKTLSTFEKIVQDLKTTMEDAIENAEKMLNQ